MTKAGLHQIPENLDHTTSHHKLLELPSLLLSQCCGPDLFQQPAADVIPFAAPVISAYRVASGYYLSYIVSSNLTNLEQPTIAVNSRSSHSGYSAIMQWLSKEGIEDYSILETGSHANSVKELQIGRADLAAVDALSWRFIDTTAVSVIDSSKPALAPPFITGAESNIPRELLVSALHSAFQQHGSPMGIAGAIAVSKADYQSLAITKTRKALA